MKFVFMALGAFMIGIFFNVYKTVQVETRIYKNVEDCFAEAGSCATDELIRCIQNKRFSK